MSSPSAEEKELLEACKALGVDTKEKLEEYIKLKSPTVTVSTSHPRISIFYGDTEKLVKGECLYDQWRYEVRSLLMEKSYPPEVILQAIRKSVKGEASRVIMRLSPKAGIPEILTKFDSVYGVVESKESLLAEFYSAKQKESENIREWSCRLEDILGKAVEKDLVKITDSNKMLCSMFWTGMRQEMKDVCGFKFDTIDDFDTLRTEIRKIEKEHKKEDKACLSKSAVYKEDKEKDELREMIQNLTLKVSSMEDRLSDMASCRMQPGAVSGNTQRSAGNKGHEYQPSGYDRESAYGKSGRVDSRQRDDRDRDNGGRKGYGAGLRSYGGERGNGNWRFGKQQGRGYDRGRGGYERQDGPMCFRCRKRGHLQWECKENLN